MTSVVQSVQLYSAFGPYARWCHFAPPPHTLLVHWCMALLRSTAHLRHDTNLPSTTIKSGDLTPFLCNWLFRVKGIPNDQPVQCIRQNSSHQVCQTCICTYSHGFESNICIHIKKGRSTQIIHRKETKKMLWLIRT